MSTKLNCTVNTHEEANLTIACSSELCQPQTSFTIIVGSTKCNLIENSFTSTPHPPVTTVVSNNIPNTTMITESNGATQLTQTTEVRQLPAITVISTSTPDTTTTERIEASPPATECVTTIIGLGAVVGLLVVLLVVVTTGWVWTCWVMMKRGGIIISSKQVR